MQRMNKAMIHMINVAYTIMEQMDGLKTMNYQTEYTEVTWSILDGKFFSIISGLKDLLEHKDPHSISDCKEFIRQWEALKQRASQYNPAPIHCECKEGH